MKTSVSLAVFQIFAALPPFVVTQYVPSGLKLIVCSLDTLFSSLRSILLIFSPPAMSQIFRVPSLFAVAKFRPSGLTQIPVINSSPSK